MWPEDDPGVGELEGLQRTALALKNEAEELAYPIESLHAAIAFSETVWTGPGAENWRVLIAGQAAEIARRVEVSENLARILREFGYDLDDIFYRVHRQQHLREGALDEYRAALRAAQAFGEHLDLPPTPTPGPAPAINGWEEYCAADREIARLATRRHESEDTCAARLRAALPADWAAVSRVGSIARVDPASLTPVALASALERCTPDQVREYLDSLGEEERARFWPLLSGQLVERLIDKVPLYIGNLNGIPFAVRHRGNVLALEREHERLTEQLATVEALRESAVTGSEEYQKLGRQRNELRASLSDMNALWEIFGTDLAHNYDPPRTLIAYDHSEAGPPLASIALGDLDAAREIPVFVPGMSSSTADPTGYLHGMENLLEGKPDQAGVLFLGYNAPNLATVFLPHSARAGAPRLNSLLSGIAAARSSDRIRLSVIGHSYGTTLLAYALPDNRASLDSVTLLGSAGVPLGFSVEEFGAPDERVFVTEPWGDFTADLGRIGSLRRNPEDPQFGAVAFGSDGTTLPTGEVLLPTTDHGAAVAGDGHYTGAYLDANTEALWNLRFITSGAFDQLTEGDTKDAPGSMEESEYD